MKLLQDELKGHLWSASMIHPFLDSNKNSSLSQSILHQFQCAAFHMHQYPDITAIDLSIKVK